MRNARAWALLLIAILAACVPPPPAPEIPRVPAAFPDEFYRRAAERGPPVYRIDPARSQAVIYVYRDGSLARLGHDHAIAGRQIHGYVLLPGELAAAQADLYVPLAALSVDDPALRAQAGFASTPSAADITGTERNMQESVLETARYPFALLHLTRAEGELPSLTVTAEITLHGVTYTQKIPVSVEVTDTGLHASGAFPLRQSDFGMAPYGLLGGALRVRDSVDVRFELYARRIEKGP